MARPKKEEPVSATENIQTGILDSDFIPLDDLVYAPLRALANSNIQLKQSILDNIQSMGTVKQNGQEEILYLKNMNIAYDHVRPEAGEGYNMENLQLQVPLLSIIPVTNLSVEKAEIEFSTEIRAVREGERNFQITGRICSPEQRNTDFLPKVSFKMNISSLSATEGIQRLTDILSADQVVKQLDTTPISVDGNLHTEEQKQLWQINGEMKAQVKKLSALYQKLTNMMEEQERLQQISQTAFPEDTYIYDKNKYLRIQSEITNEVMRLKEHIIDQEITLSKGKENG